MPIGSSLGITLPTQGTTTNWGTTLNTELQKIIDAVEASVPASAITFSADFDLNDNGLTSIAHCTFDEQSSAPTELRSLYFDSSADLYCRDGSNNAIQITDNATAGLSGAGGSITGGGYGSSGVALSWDGTYYNFKDGSGSDDYADVRLNTVLLRDGSGNAITLDCPSISSDYTVTFPTATPASDTIVSVDSSGQLIFSNTIDEAITAGAGLTASANQDITVSGTGRFKHGDYYVHIPAMKIHPEYSASDNEPGLIQDGSSDWYIGQNGAVSASLWTGYVPIEIPRGARITNIVGYGDRGSDASSQIDFTLRIYNISDGTSSSTDTFSTSAGTGDASADSGALTRTLGATDAASVLVDLSSASATSKDGHFYGLIVTYDYP